MVIAGKTSDRIGMERRVRHVVFVGQLPICGPWVNVDPRTKTGALDARVESAERLWAELRRQSRTSFEVEYDDDVVVRG